MFYVIKHPLASLRMTMVVNQGDITEGYKHGIDIRHWDIIAKCDTEVDAVNFALTYEVVFGVCLNYKLPGDSAVLYTANLPQHS